jgi:hypothetical protein
MNRLRVEPLPNPSAKFATSKAIQPSADQSQPASLPSQPNNTESGGNEEEVLKSAQTASVSPTIRRSRAHTVAVVLGPTREENLRRGSGALTSRNLEEGRWGEGLPTHFELGDDRGELNDEVVGMLDVVDPEVSTSTFHTLCW